MDTALEAEPTYRALQDDLQLAVARADTVERMAASAQSEHDAKAGAYQADPIFMYLHRRNYGSGTAAGRWCTVDGWLAGLCGFDRARREYATLVELPPYLQEHSGRARDDVEAARQPVQQARDAALARAGGDPLRQQLQTAQSAVAQALLAEQLHRQTVDAKQAQIDGFRSWTDAEGGALLTALARTRRPRAWTTCTAASPPPRPARTMPCLNASMAVACAWTRSTAWWLSTPVKWPC